MKKNILISLIIFTFTSCYQKKPVVFHLNTMKDTTFYFVSQQKSPAVLEINVKGYVDSSFMIRHFMISGGNVNKVLKHDWYNDTVAVSFKRYKASKGYLILECQTY